MNGTHRILLMVYESEITHPFLDNPKFNTGPFFKVRVI